MASTAAASAAFSSPRPISRAAAIAAGGNVTNLTTRLSGDLYVVVAEVDLPPSADAGALGDRLAAVGTYLGVQVSLRPVEPDLL